MTGRTPRWATPTTGNDKTDKTDKTDERSEP